jgi:hypothetical protein
MKAPSRISTVDMQQGENLCPVSEVRTEKRVGELSSKTLFQEVNQILHETR